MSYNNNNIEVFEYIENPETSFLEHKQKFSFEKLGHRSAVRAIDISDND